jgi:hypothetical protein
MDARNPTGTDRFEHHPARRVGSNMAVIGYSGAWSQSRHEEHLKKLQDALAQAELRWHGEPVWARFDPPWKPWFMRRNEIWLELDRLAR